MKSIKKVSLIKKWHLGIDGFVEVIIVKLINTEN